MTDHEFDGALIASAFSLVAQVGWRAVTVVDAARHAGLKLDRARARFPDKAAILLRFGQMADGHALADALQDGPVRERLFDLVMRRFDALQLHRPGVIALLRDLPADPAAALLLAAATGRSMGWMLQAAGVTTTGLRGGLAIHAMVAAWLYTLRAWQKDESADLSGTMAAMDRALSQAERVAIWFGTAPAPEAEAAPKPFPEVPAEEINLSGTISGAADGPPPAAGAI